VIRRYLHLVLVAGLGLAILGLGLTPTPGNSLFYIQAATQSEGHGTAAKSRTDRFGDALPQGALFRIGTLRLQQGTSIARLAASSDGTHIASVGIDGYLSIWETATGREKVRFAAPGAGEGWLAFSPDGKLLALNREGKLCLFDVGSGKVVSSLGTTASSGTFTNDGKTITAVQAEDRSYLIRSWDLENGKAIKGWTYEPEVPGPGCHVWRVEPRLSSGGARLATLETDLSVQNDQYTLRLCDGITGKELGRLKPQAAMVTDIAHSIDGKMLALASGNGTIQVLDAASGKELMQWTCDSRCLGNGRFQVVFAPDGQLIVSYPEGGLTRWDSQTGKKLRAYANARGYATFCRQGKVLVAQSQRSLCGIVVLDAESGKDLCPMPEPDSCVAISADARLLVWPESGSLILADARSGREIRRWSTDQGFIRALAFSPDGTILASAGQEKGVCLWEVATGRMIRSLLHKDVYSLAFSADSRQLASTTWMLSPEVCLWEMATGNCLGSWRGKDLALHDSRQQVIALAGSNLEVLNLIDVTTGKVLHMLNGYQESIGYECRFANGRSWQKGAFRLRFSPDGSMLLAGGRNGTSDGVIHFWNVTTGKRRAPILDGKNVILGRLAFSPNSQFLALMSSDRLMCLMSARTGKVVRNLGEGGDAMDAEPTFTPDSRVVVTAVKGLVQFWEVATGGEIARREAHRGDVSAMVAAADGRCIVTTSSWDNTMLVWDMNRLVSDPLGRLLTDAELETLWQDLAEPDAAKGRGAVEALVAVPTQAVKLLRLRLSRITPVDEKQIARLVDDLDGPHLGRRQKATMELARLGELAGPALRDADKCGPSQEAQHRIDELLQKLDATDLPVDTLRIVRAVSVLELIGSPEARAILEPLASGAVGARLSEEAKGSLERLRKLPPEK
jgi:WD40 repeat protein